MYILGVNPQYQIERRDLHSGALVAEFGTGGVITENPSGGIAVPYAVVTDSSGLYIGGFDAGGTGGSLQWRIEKRDLASGTFLEEGLTGMGS